MLGKNNEPISEENSDDGQSDGFDAEEYERTKREAEEEWVKQCIHNFNFYILGRDA